MPLNTTEELIEDLRQGKMIVLMDDEDRENEGDLIMVAELVTPEHINFMIKHARGLLCLPMSVEMCERLDLPMMVSHNKSKYSTPFTVSIEAAEGVSTGISAADRAHTILTAVNPNAKPSDVAQPGHIFPLMAQPGGVMSRAGHTEAACDLAKLAGYSPAGAIIEIINDDGSMARRPDLERFAEQHQLKIGTIADLIHYRTTKEKTVEPIAVRNVATPYGEFTLHTFRDFQGKFHFAMVKGEVDAEPTLVRVHVMDAARDLLFIKRDDSATWTYQDALKRVSEEGRGVVVMLCHDSANESFDASVDALLSGTTRKATTESHYKQVGTGSQILRSLGVRKMRVMSAPIRFSALSGFDLEVVEHILPDADR
jgi:3,4-dihydroxy 2-butanone 4-phosphate synthase/GTP cyclohydrolase II